MTTSPLFKMLKLDTIKTGTIISVSLMVWPQFAM